MLKRIISPILIICVSCLFAGEKIANPCIKSETNCQFTVTTPQGVQFKLFIGKDKGGYISFITPQGESKPILTDYLYNSTFYLDCPDLLEQVRPSATLGSASTFIDLKNQSIASQFVPGVFAVNCAKRAVAYENDTVSDGSVFVSPLNQLYQVIRIDSQVQVDNFSEIRREESHFNPDGSLFVTYMLSDYSNNPPTYTKTTVTIPINYNGFVHSDAIDHSMSNTWTPTVGNGNEP